MTNDDERTTTRSDITKAVALVLGTAVLGIVPVYLWATASADDAAGAASSSSAPVSVLRESTTTSSAPATTAERPPTTASAPETTAAEPQPVAATTPEAPPSTEAAPTESSTATTAPVADTAGSATPAPSGESPPDAASPAYPTAPDGTPLPLVVIFDTETVTISGQVPTQAAKDRLAGLALANSQFPDVEVIDNMVINPAVPISVGVRVIELNSARFPESSAEILPDHALELDRVGTIMNALPNISVVVVGHADQRGDDVTNFAISDNRARAVVNYLIYLGISPMRLSSRAAGENDLLTIGDDDAALALNRRTEFIFYGLLVE